MTAVWASDSSTVQNSRFSDFPGAQAVKQAPRGGEPPSETPSPKQFPRIDKRREFDPIPLELRSMHAIADYQSGDQTGPGTV